MHGRARLGAVWVRLIPKFASIIERCNPEPENKLLRSFRLSAAAFGADELAAYSGPRFAGFGSPGSITSGSVIGGSGTSPGFSIGGGAGSGFGISVGGSGGMLPGGTPGPGPGGLGTCCLSPRCSTARPLRSGNPVATGTMNFVNAFPLSGFRKKRPATWNRESRGRVNWLFLALRLEVRHAATGKLERLPQAVACHMSCCPIPRHQRQGKSLLPPSEQHDRTSAQTAICGYGNRRDRRPREHGQRP